MRGRLGIALLIGLMVAGYAYRAWIGVRASLALERGHLLYNMGDYDASLPWLDLAAEGSNRLRGLRMAATARLDLWERDARLRGAFGLDRSRLDEAAVGFLECRCVAPGSRSGWEGLGDVYDALEWVRRERWRSTHGSRAVDGADAWERVGRPGRIAIGLTRGAVELSPNRYSLHDWLAVTLWSYGIDDQARLAIREAARVLPVYHRHRFRRIDDLPAWFEQEFADASRVALDQTPLFPRTNHLIELGKLERRIGANERAIGSLREALGRGVGDANMRAEANFHLGLALIDVGQPEEGKRALALSGEHPGFRATVQRHLAEACVRLEQYEEALEHLRRLRWDQPKQLWPCLEFARVAGLLGDWPAVIEALEWAKLIHRNDPRPYVALVEAQVEKGDLAAARSALQELATLPEADDQVRRLRWVIESPSNAAGGR